MSTPRGERWKRAATLVGASCCAAWLVVLALLVQSGGFPPHYRGVYVPPLLTMLVAYFLPYGLVRTLGEWVEARRSRGDRD